MATASTRKPKGKPTAAKAAVGAAHATQPPPQVPAIGLHAAPAALTDAFTPSEVSKDLSNFEFSLLTLMFGFQSWAKVCMDSAGFRGLSPLDILTLHAVNHRARSRRQTDICMVLNIEDPYLVAYALKKLVAAELVTGKVTGRERHYETTPAGEDACLAYRKVREEFLVPSLSWVGHRENSVSNTAGFLRTMTALYAQAGRFATAATAGLPKAPPVHTKR